MNEFAKDVMDILKRRKVTFRGLKPDYLEINLDGSLKVWFYGHENGRAIHKGLTMICADITQASEFGKSEVIAEMCEQLIDHSSARFY